MKMYLPKFYIDKFKHKYSVFCETWMRAIVRIWERSLKEFELAVDNILAFPGDSVVKHLPTNAGNVGDGFDPWIRKPLEE